MSLVANIRRREHDPAYSIGMRSGWQLRHSRDNTLGRALSHRLPAGLAGGRPQIAADSRGRSEEGRGQSEERSAKRRDGR